MHTEVDKCLSCVEKPCQNACPCDCSPKDFILAIKSKQKEDFSTSAKLIMGANPLGGICGAVCPDWFCVRACSRGNIDKPISIPQVQATIIEKAKKLKIMPEFDKKQQNGKKIAIIGSGPAGLLD